MLFVDLGLSENILKAIADCGYESPTPIQEKAIPQILMGRDLVGLAQTGTGKTAGFTLPMIEILSGGVAKARMPRSLVLAPTRELAAQVAENFDTYGKYVRLTKALLVGGESMMEQIKILDRGADVLIATPGRLLDLIERGKILLTDIKILVIDEADRMLDMGFIPDIEKIVARLPVMRQTLLFSATMPPEIQRLTKRFLSNPREVSVAPPASTAERVEQFLVRTSPRQKKDVLERIMKAEELVNAFIFCNRKRDVDTLYRGLEKSGLNVKALHGDMVQKVRTQTLQDFKDGRITLLVCSDVAARGLDIDGMSHVFNYDVPINPDDYVHRIGRTGRAGKEGRAWTLACPDDEKYLEAIEKRIQMKIKEMPVPGQPLRAAPAPRAESAAPGRLRPERDRSEHASEKRKDVRRDESPRVDRQPRPAAQPALQRESRRDHRRESEDSGRGFGDDVPGFFQKR